MSRGRQRISPLAVGVDLGGTWIRVVVLHEGRTRRHIRRATALRQLGKLLRNVVGRDAITSLVVAARGVWTPRERGAVRRQLRSLAQRVEVISDVEAALLGALDGRPGLLVLAGTGSIVLGRDGEGRVARAGGLGPLIGDEGSAFWLGREWLRLTPTVAAIARELSRRPDAVARVAAWAPLGADAAPAAATHEPARSPPPARSTWPRSPAASYEPCSCPRPCAFPGVAAWPATPGIAPASAAPSAGASPAAGKPP